MKFVILIFDRLFCQPLLWGLAAGFLFCAAVQQGPLHTPFLLRYTQSHWILQVEVLLFCGAMAVLVARFMDTARQRRHLRQYVAVGQITHRIEGRPDDYLPRRVHNTAQWVRHCSPDQLSGRLAELSDRDAQQAAAGYGLIRLVVWAIPIFGFLGTVIGITLAIAQLNGNALEESMPQVTAGLGVAFDTTAVALSLSMLLKFTQFFASRQDTTLLAQIDTLMSRQEFASSEPIDGTKCDREELQKRYDTFFAAARQEWNSMVRSAGESITTQATRTFETQLQDAKTALANQMTEFAHQMDAIVQLTQQLDVIARAESELNRNLTSLADARHFEQTVTSLAAAIQLLSLRLGDLPSPSSSTHETTAPGRSTASPQGMVPTPSPVIPPSTDSQFPRRHAA